MARRPSWCAPTSLRRQESTRIDGQQTVASGLGPLASGTAERFRQATMETESRRPRLCMTIPAPVGRQLRGRTRSSRGFIIFLSKSTMLPTSNDVAGQQFAEIARAKALAAL